MNASDDLRCGAGGVREVEEEKDEEECGDTPAGRLTHSLLMQTVPQRATASRRRQDSREYRCVCLCVDMRVCPCVLSLKVLELTGKTVMSKTLFPITFLLF